LGLPIKTVSVFAKIETFENKYSDSEVVFVKSSCFPGQTHLENSCFPVEAAALEMPIGVRILSGQSILACMQILQTQEEGPRSFSCLLKKCSHVSEVDQYLYSSTVESIIQKFMHQQQKKHSFGDAVITIYESYQQKILAKTKT